jgi:glutamate dehydrogenase/leucine dehydrogenase
MIPAVLDVIYHTQHRLDEEANHHLDTYVENAHRHVQEFANTHGFTLHYGTRIGGYERVSSAPREPKKDEALIEA